MNCLFFGSFMQSIASIDPGPFFALSLFPYIAFLLWAQKSKDIPRISLWGFRCTVLFVFMTIIFAIIAKQLYGEDLTNIDFLHGAAESFLTLSDGLILLGFIQMLGSKQVKNS